MLSTRIRRGSVIVLALGSALWMPDLARGIGFVLGESKEELKLEYDVAVTDHGTGRVTVVFTLDDAGRLDPLDEVQFTIPAEEQNSDGGRWMDLVISVDMQKTDDDRRIGRVHILKALAERAEIRLNTHTLDGQVDPLTRLHHVIPIADYLDLPPAAASAARAIEKPETEAPPATERRD
jgi:hypothetical protein